MKPRMPSPCASDFAHTTNMSAIGALLIHVMPPGSEPASGSVRPKQPIHSPSRASADTLPSAPRSHRRRSGTSQGSTGHSSSSGSPNRRARPRARPGLRRRTTRHAAILLWHRRAEQAERTHLAEDLRIGGLVLERVDDARRELVLRLRPVRNRGSSARHSRVGRRGRRDRPNRNAPYRPSNATLIYGLPQQGRGPGAQRPLQRVTTICAARPRPLPRMHYIDKTRSSNSPNASVEA